MLVSMNMVDRPLPPGKIPSPVPGCVFPQRLAFLLTPPIRKAH